MQLEFVVLQGHAELVFHPDALGENGVHLQAVMDVRFAGGFGFFQSGLGVLHQLAGHPATVGVAGNAALDGDGNVAAIE